MLESEEQRILRMRVTWQKAQNMLDVFYTDLDTQRNLVGDHNLPDWCLFKLEISFDQINMSTNILKRNDAARVKQELKVAREQSQKSQEEEREKQRLAKYEKEKSELDRQLDLARRKAKLKQLKTNKKKVKEHEDERGQRTRRSQSSTGTGVNA